MIAFKTTFTARELRWFGPLFLVFAGILGALAWRQFDAPQIAKGIWVTGGIIVILSSLVPALRRLFFIAWLGAVYPLGWLLSHLLLAGVFYLVVLPIGLITKLCRYDPLRRHFDRSAKSYWIKRETKEGFDRYFRQF